jgi:hypothetical protein
MQRLPLQKPPSLIAVTACALFGTPMPQYLNALTIATNQAMANTGATSIFIMDGADVDNKHITNSPLQISLPDGKQIQSTHVCSIIIMGLPTVLTGHIVPSLSIASLIGIQPLCKAGCKLLFNNTKYKVTFNGKVILTGYKDPSTNLWTLPILTKRVWTTPSLVAVSPHSAHMMLSHHVEHTKAPMCHAMAPEQPSPCVMRGNLMMALPLLQPNPCIDHAPHLQPLEPAISTRASTWQPLHTQCIHAPILLCLSINLWVIPRSLLC